MKKQDKLQGHSISIQGGGISYGVVAAAGSNITSTVFNINPYGEKILIDTIVNDDSIELVYKSYPTFTYTYYGPQPDPKVWKDIYKCINGKLQITETVEGTYIWASEESYEF